MMRGSGLFYNHDGHPNGSRNIKMRGCANKQPLFKRNLNAGEMDRLDKRVDNLGKHFDLAQKDVQEIKTSTGKISNRGRRIEDYDVESDEVKNVVSTAGFAFSLTGHK